MAIEQQQSHVDADHHKRDRLPTVGRTLRTATVTDEADCIKAEEQGAKAKQRGIGRLPCGSDVATVQRQQDRRKHGRTGRGDAPGIRELSDEVAGLIEQLAGRLAESGLAASSKFVDSDWA